MSIPAEIKRCQGIAMQKEAELELAKEQLIEAQKKAWAPIPMSILRETLIKYGKPIPCISWYDWARGSWEYETEAAIHRDAVKIGGYESNDRFLGSIGLFISKEAYDATR